VRARVRSQGSGVRGQERSPRAATRGLASFPNSSLGTSSRRNSVSGAHLGGARNGVSQAAFPNGSLGTRKPTGDNPWAFSFLTPDSWPLTSGVPRQPREDRGKAHGLQPPWALSFACLLPTAYCLLPSAYCRNRRDFSSGFGGCSADPSYAGCGAPARDKAASCYTLRDAPARTLAGEGPRGHRGRAAATHGFGANLSKESR
jgi:hypothetical protein